MPTFQTIRMHPELYARLVTESNASTTPTNLGNSTDDIIDHAGTNNDLPPTANSDRNAASLLPSNISVIETPQALLSRHANSMRLWDPTTEVAKIISMQQVQKLRHEVSTALLEHSKAARQCQFVSAQSRKRARPNNNNNNNNAYANDSEAAVNDGTTTCLALNFPGMNSALELYNYEQTMVSERFSHLSTGCKALDTMLSVFNSTTGSSATGIPLGHVTQLAGPSATGKSQLAIQVIASASVLPVECWYLTTTTSPLAFVKRLQQMLPGGNTTAVLQRTFVVPVVNEYEILRELAKLEEHFRSKKQSESPPEANVTLLILDSISTCLVASDYNESLLYQIAMTIKQLARTYYMAAVVINGAVQNRSNERNDNGDEDIDAAPLPQRSCKPALGRTWAMAADIHVWMDRHENVFTATLDKHPTKRSGHETAVFTVTSRGIQELTTASGAHVSNNQ